MWILLLFVEASSESFYDISMAVSSANVAVVISCDADILEVKEYVILNSSAD